MATLRLRDSASASTSAPTAQPQQRQRRPYSEYRLEADLAKELQRAEAAESAAQGAQPSCTAVTHDPLQQRSA